MPLSLSKTPASACPGYALIIGLVRSSITGIGKNSYRVGEAKFQAGDGLDKALFYTVKLVSTASEHIGCETSVTNRKTKDQVCRSAVHNVRFKILGIGIAAEAKVTGEKIIQTQAGTDAAIMPDSITVNVIDRLLANGTHRKCVEGKFMGAIK